MTGAEGAGGRASALFFFVLPVLLVASVVVVRGSGKVETAAGVTARLLPHLPSARRVAQSEGVPLPLLLAVASAESSGRPAVRSSKGAVGLMQLMPATADDMVRLRREPPPDLTDAATSLRLGARYLSRQLRRYDGRALGRELALCAYNAGPGRVDGWLSDLGGPESRDGGIEGWVPIPETRAYVRRVLAWERHWTAELAGGAVAAR